jgi:hypothetical protein
MYMSTSLLRGHVKASVVISAALAFSTAIANAATPSTPPTLKPTSAELLAAFKALPAAFQQQDDLPEAAPVLKPKEAFLRWNSALPDKRLLALLHVRFSGVTNAYCRLVTLSADLKDPVLVKVPSQANYDDCARTSEPVYVDLNADGVDDVVFAADVKSNRYPSNVEVPVVYLSSPSAQGGYCYSDAASRQLEPADLTNARTIQAKIQREGERLGRDLLRCGSR